MQVFRPSQERGQTNFGWLDSRHTFSFGRYYDPDHMGFGALRVINDDHVAPGAGFEAHRHQDMEIISYVVKGAMEHNDSLENGSVIHAGEVQRMTAGTGVIHSEYNHSTHDPLHFIQIWMKPEQKNLEPSYEQKEFPAAARKGRLQLLGSRDGRNGSVIIHQDVNLYGGLLDKGSHTTFEIAHKRKAWLQVIRGALSVNTQPTNGLTENAKALVAGDGFGIAEPGDLALVATEEAEFLLFDLAA